MGVDRGQLPFLRNQGTPLGGCPSALAQHPVGAYYLLNECVNKGGPWSVRRQGVPSLTVSGLVRVWTGAAL